MAEHTPGPWTWTDGENPIDIATYESPGYCGNPELIGSDGEHVVGCNEYWTIGPITGPQEIVVANARLIAAAPDLLSCVESMLKHIDAARMLTPGSKAWSEEARAAIAKATGGE